MYEERQGKDLIVLTVDIIGSRPAETPANLADFMQKNKYTFPALSDLNMAITKVYGIKSTPTNFLIDKTGVIRDRRTGAFPSQTAFDDMVRQISSQ